MRPAGWNHPIVTAPIARAVDPTAYRQSSTARIRDTAGTFEWLAGQRDGGQLLSLRLPPPNSHVVTALVALYRLFDTVVGELRVNGQSLCALQVDEADGRQQL